jgi:hypothetical protein
MSVKARIILISIVSICFIFQPVISAQDGLLRKPVNAKFKNISLKQAFKKIEGQLNCYFTFEGSTINPEKRINQTFKSVPLKTCLDYMLEDSSLVYKIIDNHIIIKKKKIESRNTLINDSIPSLIILKGQIVDNLGDGPLPFANVSIMGFALGAISNAQGEFILKVPKQMIAEQICISHMGYKNTLLPINQLIDTFAVFKLERSYIAIQEVIIRKIDAKLLIKKALSKIKENYYTKSAYLTGFYRESVKRGDSYMFFSEAVVKVYKSSYSNPFEGDMIKVLKSRKMQDVKQEDTSVILKLKSGLSTCLDLDLVKNQINFLSEENFDFYNYDMSDIVTFNDRNAYLIEFKQKSSVDEALFEGKIYIDVEKLAIIGADFHINPQKVSKAQSNYVVKKKRGIKVRMTDIDYNVNYRLVNDKYYMNYIKGFLKMKVKKSGKLFPIDYETSLEMAVNEIDTLNIERFKRSEAENPYTIFFNDVRDYDEAFWENYNFMKPDEPLQESIRKISLKAKNQD